MRILIISPFTYGPLASHGGGVACYAQLKSLLLEHTIAITCFTNGKEDTTHIQYLKRVCEELRTIPLDTSIVRRLCARLTSIFRLMPAIAIMHKSIKMQTEIKKTIAEFKPDLVILQFPQMAQYVDTINQINTVIDVQDAFSVSGYRSWKAEPNIIKRIDKFINWLFWIRYEGLFYTKASSVITLTGQDLIGLKIFQPTLIGTSIPPPLELPSNKRIQQKVISNRIGFIGSFVHKPNITALNFFIRDIFPTILEQLPEVEFHVAGKSPPPEIQQNKHESVHFHGFVDDLSGFINSCAVIVIPLLSGGGIKIKTLEALAHSAPIVSTSIGVEGIEVKDGTHLLIRNDKHSFAMATLELLNNPLYSQQIGCEGAEFIRKNLNSKNWLSEFNQLALNIQINNKNE